MARTKLTKTTAAATVRIDAVDVLTAKLCESGIEFVRDAWVEKAPDNYGVVELQGEPTQMWADGHLTDSMWRVIVTMFVDDDDDSYAAQINTLLEELEADGKVDLTHTCSRAFDYDLGKVRWQWQVTISGELIREEPTPAESDPSGED